MATKYFEKFPKLLYTLDDRETGQLVPDIFRRVKINDELKENNAFYDLYDIQEGETPEIVASKFYGDPGLHWIILSYNDIIDPRFEWPLTEYELVRYIEGKYGPGSLNDINRVENLQGFAIASTFVLLNLAPGITGRLVLGGPNDPVQLPANHAPPAVNSVYITNYQRETFLNEQKRKIKILKPEVVSSIVDTFETLITK